MWTDDENPQCQWVSRRRVAKNRIEERRNRGGSAVGVLGTATARMGEEGKRVNRLSSRKAMGSWKLQKQKKAMRDNYYFHRAQRRAPQARDWCWGWFWNQTTSGRASWLER